MKKILKPAIIAVIVSCFGMHAAAQDVYEGKDPKVEKGSKREHHNMDLPGDNHHNDMQYRRIPHAGSNAGVNKGPKDSYHGMRDKGHSHHYNRGEVANLYKNSHRYRGVQRPIWAEGHEYDFDRHAYFPDYYVFYDAKKNEYAYWQNLRWNYSKDVPPAVMDVDLSQARLVIMGDVKLSESPYLYFAEFYQAYPPEYDPGLPLPPLN